MKVLLATLSIEPESRNENARNAAYPIGLAYVHSALLAAGHEARLLFLNNFGYEEAHADFFATVEEWRPDVVGFQVFSMNRVNTGAAIDRLRENYPDIRIVAGGVHVSIMYRQMVERFPGLIAVRGEGELTLPEVLDSFAGRQSLESVYGIAFWNGSGVTVTPERPLIGDLDSLPDPSHDIFFESEPGRTVAHIISTRGCPFDCSFCCLKLISKRRYRRRDIRRVVAELKNLKARYPRLREVQFHDDTLLLDNARVIEFCRLVIEEGLDLRFTCSARVKPVSAEMFDWMEKAGFTKIMFGLETGSPKLLHSIHKRITPEDVLALFRVLRGRKFDVTTFLMCGFPGETWETIDETVELVKATQRIHYNLVAGVGKLYVYPGTEIYDVMKAAGKISDEYWLADEPTPYFTVEHPLQELMAFEDKILENVSFLRIFTLRGFRFHFLSMPLAIARYFLRPRNFKTLLSVVAAGAHRSFPRFYTAFYRSYQRAVDFYIRFRRGRAEGDS